VVSVLLPIFFRVKNDNTIEFLPTDRVDLKKLKKKSLLFLSLRIAVYLYGNPEANKGIFHSLFVHLSNKKSKCTMVILHTLHPV
jgi:hypothetical protein